MTKRSVFCIFIVFAMVLSACSAPTKKMQTTESVRAAIMRLEKMTGNVSVFEMGERLFYIIEKMRLYSGYSVRTEAESSAHISLDESKVVQLDEHSDVKIESGGSDILLSLSAGNMFFHVDKPLQEKESFQIRTSNAIVGIRGTSGFVVSKNQDESTLYLMTGKAEITATSPVTGEIKQETILPGERVTVYKNEPAQNEEQLRIVKDTYTEKDVLKLATDYLNQHDTLRGQFEAETDFDWEEIFDDDDDDGDFDYDDDNY
ncbi:MAG: FecR family protein, partial [Bacillota bacterium]|nr:FecR family protein [Bacillota bacterium]